jgi:hypothetical protein
MTAFRSEVIRAATPENPRHSEATAVELRDGSILLAWSRFEGRGDNAIAEIAGVDAHVLHDDNGQATVAGTVLTGSGLEWGEERTLIGNGAGLNVMSPALARLADGGIGLLYSHRNSTTEACRMFCRSDDEGATWSNPVPLPQADSYQTGCHDRLAVLDSGRLVAPLHCTHDWHAPHLHVRTAWSDDNGATWLLSEQVVLPKVSNSGESGCIEPDVAQRADGSLLMAIRTAMGTIFRAESDDGGETWHNLRSMEVVAPVAPSLLRRIPDTSDLLLIWNWHYDWTKRLAGTRRPLAAAISTDGGDSWPTVRRKILEDDPAATYAYPSCLFIGREALITYFVTPGDAPSNQRSLKVARLPLTWLYEI